MSNLNDLFTNDGSPQYVTANGEPLEGNKTVTASYLNNDGSYADSELPAIGSNGEVNASDTQSLLRASLGLMRKRAQSEILDETTFKIASALEFQPESVRQAMSQEIFSAYQAGRVNPNSPEFMRFASQFATRIEMTMKRTAFFNKILKKGSDYKPGTGYYPITRGRNFGTCYVANDGVRVSSREYSPSVVHAQPFPLAAQVRIPTIHTVLQGPSVLDEAHGQTNLMFQVRMDAICKHLLEETAGEYNPAIRYSTLTPAILADLINNVNRHPLNSRNMLIAHDLWREIITNSAFTNWFDPYSQHKLILDGKIASIMNVDITTDGYMDPAQRVLEDGQIIVTADPENVGIWANASTNGLEVRPISGDSAGELWVGIHMYTAMIMAVVNGKAVSIATRA